MITLNRLSDPKRTILQSLADYAETHDGQIPDYIFVQVCEEYEADEDTTMLSMLDSVEYTFDRMPTGFICFGEKEHE